MAKTKIIHVAVEPKLFKALYERAKMLDVSVSDVIRTGIREVLGVKP